jgi:hypothetical protein
MVHLAVVDDASEAEEMQEMLASAGIASELEPHIGEPGLTVLVPAEQLDDAKDAIEALTEPDELVGE